MSKYFIFILLVLSSCAEFSDVFEVSPSHTVEGKGVYYTVKEGDTVVSIADQYAVSVQSIMETNNLLEAASLEVGSTLFIPGVAPQEPVRTAKREKVTKVRETVPVTTAPVIVVERDENRFIWPVDGIVTSRYGVRRKRQHDGIDISAPRGTPVKAAAKGKVVYAKKMSGYGNLIVIKHSGNFFTAYAHLSEYKTKVGDRVAQGDLIGLVGSTGRSSGPHCHFEVRHNAESRNPLFFLPKKEIRDSDEVIND